MKKRSDLARGSGLASWDWRLVGEYCIWYHIWGDEHPQLPVSWIFTKSTIADLRSLEGQAEDSDVIPKCGRNVLSLIGPAWLGLWNATWPCGTLCPQETNMVNIQPHVNLRGWISQSPWPSLWHHGFSGVSCGFFRTRWGTTIWWGAPSGYSISHAYSRQFVSCDPPSLACTSGRRRLLRPNCPNYCGTNTERVWVPSAVVMFSCWSHQSQIMAWHVIVLVCMSRLGWVALNQTVMRDVWVDQCATRDHNTPYPLLGLILTWVFLKVGCDPQLSISIEEIWKNHDWHW